MMETINHEKVFDNLVEVRLKSEAWDFQIARRVIGNRKRNKYAVMSAGVASSMAAAALIVFAILPALRNGSHEGEGLYNFINAQVDGTWNRALAGMAVSRSNDIQHIDAQYDENLDDMIEDTLVQRF